MSKLDVLAIGAHPDDIEIGMGATIAKWVEEGKKVGVCSLTYAELSSNGTVELRQEEAKQAARILGVNSLLQLDFSDRGLKKYNKEQFDQVVDLIRCYQPRLVFAPYWVDRHPDHSDCFEIVKEAIFNAGIRHYQTTNHFENHRVEQFYTYFINGTHRPDFVLDVSAFYEKKMRALHAYQSQFQKTTDEAVDTPLTNGYVKAVEARDTLFGHEVGVPYAEGFKALKPLKIDTL
ncbi:bacillithiol biosynthesis deacetylase BshB1 [Alkalihalobacillus pseudalcaliphilus]|uniref:bacillithiol biosynthesis deacetylase BshB1 n=1 Tax=Alkalihalobacillus pseudalcaliphilus TaxID=79884 RepID=UPI00064E0BAE|nr:bacillithiol biosynthesis deacetylase BshB1 [Alkalihalobacillus pseudalcaliphilus]KMK76415.1 deacetylase [Alkalihalobacillus pseudalcaliphilus]